MAAPTPTARTTPTGDRLDDGYQALITFSSNASIKLWEKAVTPPGVDGGDPIDTDTQHNVALHTQSPPSLYRLTSGSFTCAYDPAAYAAIIAMVNVLQVITVKFPNGATLAYHGWLRSFEPDGMTEGEQPEATVNIEAANQDPSGVERPAVFGSAP